MKLNTLLFIFLLSTQNVFTQNRTSLECLNREFHVVVHIITDSLFNPAALPVNAQNCINSMNKVWAPICVKFNICKTRIDSNYNFYDWLKLYKKYCNLNFDLSGFKNNKSIIRTLKFIIFNPIQALSIMKLILRSKIYIYYLNINKNLFRI